MRKFNITLSADNVQPIVTEAVEAINQNEAMQIVLDLLKLDARVVDAKQWVVTIEDVTDA